MKPLKFRAATLAAATAAASAVIALGAAQPASSAAVQPFGTRETLADPGGMMVTGWTVTDLAPSSDAIPYRVMGRLYEATVTVEADRGTVTPVIPPFSARTPTGRGYPALAWVASPHGLNPRSLMQGQRSTGKLYFDVVGEVPDSVAYTTGAGDLMLWAADPPGAAPAAPTPAPDPDPFPELPDPPPPPSPMPVGPVMPPTPVIPGPLMMPGMGWPMMPGY